MSRRRPDRTSTKPKKFRPTLETLDARDVPAAISWSGAAGDQLWSTPANWSGGQVPGAADDVTLNVPGDAPVRFAAGEVTVRQVDSHEPLVLTGGKLTTTDGMVLRGGLTLDGGALAGGTVGVLSSTLAFGPSATATATVQVTGNAKLAAGTIPAGQTVQVAGGLFDSQAAVTVTGTLTNAGTLRLDNVVKNGFQSNLSGTLVNAAGGRLEVGNTGGGERTFRGTLTNNGVIDLPASFHLDTAAAVHDNTGAIFLRNGATLTIAGTLVNRLGAYVGGGGTLAVPAGKYTDAGITDLVPAAVSGAELRPTFLRLTFSAPMDPATVADPQHYALVRDGGPVVPLTAGSYDPDGQTVTFAFATPQGAGNYRVIVAGSDVRAADGGALFGGPMSIPLGVLPAIQEVVPGTVSVALQAASDTGASFTDGITADNTPTFDVTVNAAGTITIDADGDGVADVTVTAPTAGTYAVTAPALADGTYTPRATFTPADGFPVSATAASIRIDTVAPALVPGVTPPAGPVGGRTLTFSEPLDGSAATAELVGPDGAVIETISFTDTDGSVQLTFATPITAPGRYSLRLTNVRDLAGNPAPPLTDVFDVTADTAPPTLEAFVVQDGQTQRSTVNRTSWTFSQAVNLPTLLANPADLARAFRLSRYTPAAGWEQVSVSADQFRYDPATRTLTWALAPTASLADGFYQWQVYTTYIRNAAGNPLAGGSVLTQTFHRLHGDFDGDRAVTAADLELLKPADGSTPTRPGWDPTFDLDGDGRVTARDRKLVAGFIRDGHRITPPPTP